MADWAWTPGFAFSHLGPNDGRSPGAGLASPSLGEPLQGCSAKRPQVLGPGPLHV